MTLQKVSPSQPAPPRRLPHQREAVQIVELDALLAAERLSDVLAGSSAFCQLTTDQHKPRATTASMSVEIKTVSINCQVQTGLVGPLKLKK